MCILLVYIHDVEWCTVHTTLNCSTSLFMLVKIIRRGKCRPLFPNALLTILQTSLTLTFTFVHYKYTISLCKTGQCTHKCNTGARYRRKTIRILYSECASSISYPAYKAHAPYYTDIVTCGLSGCIVFFYVMS